MDERKMHKGACLCGAVTFEAKGALASPTACHCSQCRKQSGHFWASADVPRTALTFTSDAALRWFDSSEKVRRGFCSICGSSLFWAPIDGDTISIAMGAFDASTSMRLKRHIFVADKGDYYDIADGLPQNPQ